VITHWSVLDLIAPSYLSTDLYNQSRFREGIEICQTTSALANNYLVTHNHARCKEACGNPIEVEELYEKSIALCDKEIAKAQKNYENDKSTFYKYQCAKASILHNLATFNSHRGRINEARELYSEALRLQWHWGDIDGKAATLQCLGVLDINIGETERGIISLKQALEIFEARSNHLGKSAILYCMGCLMIDKNQYGDAIKYLEQSLELKIVHGDFPGQALAYSKIGSIYRKLGDFENAFNFQLKSLNICKKFGLSREKASPIMELSELKFRQGLKQEAMQLMRTALSLETYLSDRASIMTMYGLMLLDLCPLKPAICRKN
jgi:tetratricopeptide (TPR) repeat protein